MEISTLEEKIKSYMQKSNTQIVNNSSNKKRLKSASFTKILKNKIFKGYEKIKFMKNKSFNMKYFLKSKPEEKYLLSDEKYNIYYEKKYLNKYNHIPKKDYFLIKNLSARTNLISPHKQLKNNKSKSAKDLFITDKKRIPVKRRQMPKKSKLYDRNVNKININDSSKIFNCYYEYTLYSKYPFIYVDKIEDNIANPTDMKNYPHYISKFKDKNKNQEHFLFNISHLKEKKNKNIYKSITPRLFLNKNKENINNRNIKELENCYLISFSPLKFKEKYINKNFCINSFDNNKIKNIINEKYKIPLENSKCLVNDDSLKLYDNSVTLRNKKSNIN